LLVAWVIVVFVSVLAHELGHALTARRFGARVSITLTTLGGFTRWEKPGDGMTPGKRALVAAAGSAVGILLGLGVLGVFMATRPWGTTAASVVLMIAWVNVGWGVLNWLPIRPLDGGHLVLAMLDMVAPRRSESIASVIFLITSLAALVAAIYYQFYFAAILAGFMAWAEISRRVAPSPRPRPAPPPPPPNLFDLDPPSPAPEEGRRSAD
jgi:membrane-associated protease RseP (regulator of RpoE activity)